MVVWGDLINTQNGQTLDNLKSVAVNNSDILKQIQSQMSSKNIVDVRMNMCYLYCSHVIGHFYPFIFIMKTRRSDVLQILKSSKEKWNRSITTTATATEIFIKNLDTAGLRIRKTVPPDGNCLFNAVCDQLRRLKISWMRHSRLCQLTVEHLRRNPFIVWHYYIQWLVYI